MFDLVAADYDNVGVPFFRPIATGLVEAVGAAPGDRALDLGCGNGVSSRALAAAVGHDGSLVGIDLSPAMVELARRALNGALRLLAPGGRIGLSTFGPSSPEWQALESHLREFMPAMDPRMVGPQSPFATDAGMADLLTNAGAVGVQTSSRRVEFQFGGFDQWVRFSRSVGQRVA